MAVGSGQDTTEWNAVSVGRTRAFQTLLAAVDRGTPGHLAASGSLGDGAVHSDLVEDEADDPVVGVQRDLLELGEDAESYPLVATAADRGGRADRVGDRLVRTAEAQQLQELVEDDPVADASAVAAEWMVRVELGTLGKQCHELVPERFGEP
ncbi:hypothetical protein GCM10027073_42290 [Streptomyces chlorus]